MVGNFKKLYIVTFRIQHLILAAANGWPEALYYMVDWLRKLFILCSSLWQCDGQCDTVMKPIIWNLYLFRFQMEPHTTKQFRGSSPTTNGQQTSVTWKSINTIRATTIHWLSVKMVGTMTRNPFRHPSLQTLVECHVLILIISLNSEVLDLYRTLQCWSYQTYRYYYRHYYADADEKGRFLNLDFLI